MAEPEISDTLRNETRAAWHRYVDMLTPFRPQLHAYCRKLTGDIWDAEDLVHDTLLKGFASLGMVHGTIDNPRGYLTRMATNLWIDRQRRRRAEAHALVLDMPESSQTEAADIAGVRNASARLLETLAPQERAALVMKDVFDMGLKDIAAILSTTENAVKAALHRGRERLKGDQPVARHSVSPELVERFMRCLNGSDLQGMLALMLDTATVEMPGADLEMGRAEFERKGGWLWQSVNVHPDLPADQRPPKWTNEFVVFRGEPMIVSFLPPPFEKTLQGITRFEEVDGKIAYLRSYCFSPETVAEVAAELGLKAGWAPYRFPAQG